LIASVLLGPGFVAMILLVRHDGSSITV